MSDHDLERRYLDDASARRIAQQEFRRPVVVVAGAGTGKTSILVARIIAWCLGPGWQQAVSEVSGSSDEVATRVLEGVVAITFTEAAAAEMAERVAAALAALARDEIPTGVDPAALPQQPLRRPRALALLSAVSRLHARTIHSFCQWLLRCYPVEAGIDPAFSVDADGLKLEELIHEVVDDALREAFTQRRDPRWIELVGAGIGPQQVASALTELVQQGLSPAELARDPFAPAVLQELVEELREALSRFWHAEQGRLARVTRGRKTTETIVALEILDRGIEDAMSSTESLRELVQATPAPALERLAKWGSGTYGKAEASALAGIAGRVTTAASRLSRVLHGLSRLRPRELAVARAVLGPLLERIGREMRARGLITFHGLLEGARELLAGSPLLCDQVRRGFRQLLVDEFQDTDQLQCEIVRLLALEGRKEERPGLFIVGDPKQSIYGWRNADLLAYQSMVDRVAAAGGLSCHLSVNFRSAPPILAEVQRVIEPVMHEEHGLQPALQPLLPCRERAGSQGYRDGSRVAVEHWISWPREQPGAAPNPAGRSAEATELEAAVLARELLTLHEQGGEPWSEMAVLLRSGSDLDVYLEAMREHAVPYAVSREREYFRRREVIEAAALVRWLIDPGDRLALLTLLRSDVVGVPDVALLPLWRAGLPASLARLDRHDGEAIEEIAALVSNAAAMISDDPPGAARLSGWQRGLLLAVEHLAMLRSSLDREPPDRFVERLRSLWLPEASAAARYLGSFRLARLERFFSDLERELVEGDGSLTALARFLRRAVERERESQEPATPEVTGDAVQVMTIHGAKGLDFRQVFVVQLHKRHRTGGGDAIAEVLSFQGKPAYSLFGWPTPQLLRAAAWAERVEKAEQVRLLYVAMTRAKDRLVLAGKWPEPPVPVEPEQASCLLDLLGHRGLSCGLAGRIDLERGSWTDGHGAQWVLPALAPAATEVPVVRAASCYRVPDDRVLTDAARLNRLRALAAERMRRPTSTAASAEAHRLLEPAVAEPEAPQAISGSGRAAATAVGTAVHGLLEVIDLHGDLPAQLSVARTRLAETLAGELEPDLMVEASRRLGEIMDSLEQGRCLARLQEIAGTVVARELPLLLPPPDDGEEGPVGFIAGVADLVYRDPDSGALVVADYKTDRVESDEQIAERSRAYREQGRIYSRAVREALDLEYEPPFELWFLSADRIERLRKG